MGLQRELFVYPTNYQLSSPRIYFKIHLDKIPIDCIILIDKTRISFLVIKFYIQYSCNIRLAFSGATVVDSQSYNNVFYGFCYRSV